MKTFLSFDDAGADDDYPARNVTMGDIRAWHDVAEKAHVALAQLIPDPRNVNVWDWPVENRADAECLQEAWEMISDVL